MNLPNFLIPTIEDRLRILGALQKSHGPIASSLEMAPICSCDSDCNGSCPCDCACNDCGVCICGDCDCTIN